MENLYIMNGSAPEGGGLAVATDTGDVTLFNNIIAGNTATGFGGGLSLRVRGSAQTVLVANNTIDGNGSTGIDLSASDLPVRVELRNNIVTSNGGYGISAYPFDGELQTIGYNDVWNNGWGEYDEVEPDDGVWQMYSTQIIVLVIVVVIGVGTVVYRVLEDWGWVDSLYFSVITLTTVGYGDLAPTSSASKLFTVGYLITGISLLGAAANEVLKRRGRRFAARRARRRS